MQDKGCRDGFSPARQPRLLVGAGRPKPREKDAREHPFLSRLRRLLCAWRGEYPWKSCVSGAFIAFFILLLCGVSLMILPLIVTLLVPITLMIKGFPVLILQGAWLYPNPLSLFSRYVIW